jgi:hypothetical protein
MSGAPFPAGFAGSGAFDFEVVESPRRKLGKVRIGPQLQPQRPIDADPSPQKKEGGYLVEYPPLVSSSKQEIYCPDAEAVVAARAICFSVACADTLNRNVMPNSGNCMAVT